MGSFQNGCCARVFLNSRQSTPQNLAETHGVVLYAK